MAVTARGCSSLPERKFPGLMLFWTLAFLYASFAALSFQKLVLPMFPDLHAGYGLLNNDAIAFHRIAAGLAERIKEFGWQEWQLFPGAAANVGVLAAIYARFGPDPAWFIPLNAAAHAAGATLIYRLGRSVASGDEGYLGGLLAGIFFLVSPSSLQWYGQNHRDAFVIVGTLLVLLAWLYTYGVEDKIDFRQKFFLAGMAIFGIVLAGLTRPYFPVVILLGLLASLVLVSTCSLLTSVRRSAHGFASRGMIIAIVAGVSLTLVGKGVDSANVYKVLSQSETLAPPENSDEWHWRVTPWLPDGIDRVFQRAAEIRRGMVGFGKTIGAGSTIDGDAVPASALEVLEYLPRALWTGLFVPFPDSWSEKISAPRLVGAVETACWYLIVSGIVVALMRDRGAGMLAGIGFCCTVLIIQSFVHPNIGTLYRQRYGVWHFLSLCGAVGWASYILLVFRNFELRKKFQEGGASITVATTAIAKRPSGIDALAASGAVVMLITLACYLGFLARDLLLVKQMGIAGGLDAFFAAAMIPMFFVTCLAMPLADAMTSPFLSLGREGQDSSREEFVQRLLGFAAATLGVVAALVALAAPYVVGVVLGEMDSETAVSATGMLRWFAPIILLSAWTVIGNAALNALRHSRDAALGQLVVPVVTIFALLASPAADAPFATIVGMLVGTLLNVAWVFRRLLLHGIRLLPAFPDPELLRPATASYRRLFLAASLTAALVPLNYAFAASVVSGGLSAWALANKIVVLFTGLASVGASAVVLPYLARMLAQGVGVQDDAHFLLVAGSWIGGLLAVGVLLFADPLVAAALSGSVTSSQLSDLSGIVKIGVLQLPIAIAGALVAKMAIVSGASSRVLFAAGLGFACNLLVNLLLVPHIGVLGVAVGTLVATALSTLTLMLSARTKIGLALREIVTLLVGWLVWAGAGVAASSQSTAAVACAVLAVGGLAWAQFRNWADVRY